MKHKLDIEKVNTIFGELINTGHHYSPVKFPKIYGYNLIFSGRSGGKTTNILLWCLIAFWYTQTVTMYVKTTTQETTRKYINTLFNTINNYITDKNLNYVQIITNCKYDKILYDYHKKHFVLHNSKSGNKILPDDIVFMNVCSLADAYEMRSSHNNPQENILFYDEIINDNVNKESLLRFMHIVKTCLTSREDSIIFMTGNLGTGNMAILQSMGIYENVFSEQKNFAVYETDLGTKCAVEIFAPDTEKAEEYDIMNTRFFGFRCEGAEIVRGKALPTPTTRHLPELSAGDKWIITPTSLYIHSIGYFLRVYHCVCKTWQSMYYVKQSIKPLHNGEDLTLTDDKIYSQLHPYSYYNVGKQFDIARDFATKFLRKDVCFDSDMTEIAVTAFYNNHLKES